MNTTNILWKVSFRLYYQEGYITEEIFIQNYTNSIEANKLMLSLPPLSKNEFNNMTNKLKNDVNFVATGELPNIKADFKHQWVSYLVELLHSQMINDLEFNKYKANIDFNKTNWLISEMSSINEVLELYRLKIVIDNSENIDFIDSPSYELLMLANEIDV